MRVILLPGDGIGPVVLAEAERVLRAVGVDDLVPMPFGLGSFEATGEAVPEATLAAVREAGVALMGAATTPTEGVSSPVLALRRALRLDLMVRPAHGVTIVGHAFEGLYAEPEDPGPPARATWSVTPEGAEHLLRAAFERARRKVTVVDKPTVLRGAARIFREAGARAARPDIAFEVVNADAFVAGLVRDPGAWDVVAATSFVADVLSDLTAALGGGVGTAPSASLGPGVAVFEPVHGSAPRRAGERPARVNPVGAILAAAMLLDHVGRPHDAARVRHAVAETERDGLLTPDRGGTATTDEVGRAVAERL